ncbi:hypothetical protein CEXT_756891 [Caerostris extrusa]|uniref:Uncharacterized protein n=1 Tax=Caerostris extrusa TaxID=172846 RepID=A0AAV4PLR1_CAEEX|nr:hypothetical protein CEXT_756891 [Caerostris extrusa]
MWLNDSSLSAELLVAMLELEHPDVIFELNVQRKLAEVEVLSNDLVDGGLNGEPVVLINANFIVSSRSLYIVRALEVKDVVVTSGDFVQSL